ncbi:MAG: PAS domain S-box protein, partial [Alphaproteobacteria bacterium]|nr:PAS domain S-box protein [Alphaproteobacteria bacterium]
MLKIMSMELEEASETIAPELPSLTGDAYAEALHAVHENNIGVFAIFSRAGQGQFVISSCNTLFCDLTGYSREELEGYNIQQLFEPRTCTVLKQHLALCLQQAGRLHFEETLYTDTGVHILTGNLVPIADEQGRSRGILLMATTQPESQDQISGENGLAYIEEAFNRLLSAGSNTMCILDNRGMCNYLSTNWKRLTGYDQEECIGRSFLHFVHPEDRAAFSRAAYIEQGGPAHDVVSDRNSTLEYRLLHADGRWHWHEADITVRHDVDSGTDSSRFVNISRDITDHKHTQEQLHKAQLATELANRSRAEFLSNMSHELRTPLNAIIGFSEFMRNEMGGPVYNPTYLEYLNDIYESGHALLGIINNVLEASSIEHGEAFLREEDVDIAPLVKQAIELQFGQALRGRVPVKTQLFEQPLMARVDPAKFRQAISHILSNAIKFTPEHGTVVVKSTLTSAGDLLITVTDTGVGIPHEKIERILSPFELVDASFSKKKSGAGLGLPLARSFIKMHGGMLSIESTEGYGTQ